MGLDDPRPATSSSRDRTHSNNPVSRLRVQVHYDTDGVCDVWIEHGDDTILVTVTERDDNPGCPITARIDSIATLIARTMPSASMPEVRFVEHYREDRDDRYNEVAFAWTARREAQRPQRMRLGVGGYHQLRAGLGIRTG